MGSPDGPARAPSSRCLNLHQRNKPVHLRFFGREACQNAAHAQRLLTELWTYPVVAGRRRVALVEDQIEDGKHRGKARRALVPVRDLERHTLLGEHLLGANDALGNGRLRNEKGARDLLGGQAADQSQGKCDLRLGRQNWMAGGEHETKQIVADVFVERLIGIRRRILLELEFVAERVMLAFGELVAAEAVDGAMFGGRHEPGTWIVGDA